MAYLFPPMDDEPPADFIAFVAARLELLRREAMRLCGGDRSASSLAMDVLTDVAGHWRRLRWESRVRDRDVRGDYLVHRLAKRTQQWREEQTYPVEVSFLPPPKAYARPAPATVAQRLAPLVPTTVRDEAGVVAEAEIAWVHAYRRHIWHRYARLCGGGLLLVGSLIQFMSQASGSG